jgi:Mg-chelatase subunit ChlI
MRRRIAVAMDDALFPADEIPEIAPAPAYRVLARKYRPSNFDSLLGQDAMVRTLGNAIARQQIAQAWLLTGVRGVGKTSTARIIAKALELHRPRRHRRPDNQPVRRLRCLRSDCRGPSHRCRRDGRRVEHRRR